MRNTARATCEPPRPEEPSLDRARESGLHGDAFNVFNTPQFNNPGSNLDDPTTFGKLTSVKLYTNRQIQLAARLTF
jgi:hypothetical protein